MLCSQNYYPKCILSLSLCVIEFYCFFIVPDMIFFSCFKFCVTVNTQKNTIDTGIIGGIVMLFGSDRSAQEHPGLPYRGHHSSAVRREGGGSKRGWKERGMERSPHAHTQYECSLSFPTSFSKPRCPTSTDLLIPLSVNINRKNRQKKRGDKKNYLERSTCI